MIIDKLENISNYTQIPDYVVNFVKCLSGDTECMRYDLIDDDFVNVETYSTKTIQNSKFESHDKYIDIQLLLNGVEKIYIRSREDLKEKAPYSTEKDITFYSNPVEGSDYVTLDGSNFVMIYPHEAHAPQVAINNNPSNVKKAVVKIRI